MCIKCVRRLQNSKTEFSPELKHFFFRFIGIHISIHNLFTVYYLEQYIQPKLSLIAIVIANNWIELWPVFQGYASLIKPANKYLTSFRTVLTYCHDLNKQHCGDLWMDIYEMWILIKKFSDDIDKK